MRWFFVSLILLIAATVRAQHCPWDCSGLLLIKTDVSPENINKLFPVLVNEKKEIIVDTIYGTGKPTYDTCNLLYYDDYLAYRTKKIELHYWYAHDTVYHFAKGNYIIKVNFCKYRNKKLFLRLNDPYSRGIRYKYVEIPNTALIHLHDYNMEINARATNTIKEAVSKSLITIDCAAWGLKAEDCH
jgi:hypothetical protein